MDFFSVAKQFTQYYYQTFDSNRAGLLPLYRADSMLTYEGSQIQGANAIIEKLTSLPFQKIQHNVTTVDAQPSSKQSADIIVSATGQLMVDDSPNPLNFSQVFHLVNEGGTYYVYNDIFRLIFGV